MNLSIRACEKKVGTRHLRNRVGGQGDKGTRGTRGPHEVGIRGEGELGAPTKWGLGAKGNLAQSSSPPSPLTPLPLCPSPLTKPSGNNSVIFV